MLLPEIDRQQELGKEVVFRADAAFAKREIYETLEERGVKYAIRLPANDSRLRDIEELLTRPVGRPSVLRSLRLQTCKLDNLGRGLRHALPYVHDVHHVPEEVPLSDTPSV